MDLKQQIDSQVKKWLGTQENFCGELGIKQGNYGRKWKAFTNQFNWINNFLAPIKGKLKIEWEDEKCLDHKDNPCSIHFIGFLHCPYDYTSCKKCPHYLKPDINHDKT